VTDRRDDESGAGVFVLQTKRRGAFEGVHVNRMNIGARTTLSFHVAASKDTTVLVRELTLLENSVPGPIGFVPSGAFRNGLPRSASAASVCSVGGSDAQSVGSDSCGSATPVYSRWPSHASDGSSVVFGEEPPGVTRRELQQAASAWCSRQVSDNDDIEGEGEGNDGNDDAVNSTAANSTPGGNWVSSQGSRVSADDAQRQENDGVRLVAGNVITEMDRLGNCFFLGIVTSLHPTDDERGWASRASVLRAQVVTHMRNNARDYEPHMPLTCTKAHPRGMTWQQYLVYMVGPPWPFPENNNTYNDNLQLHIIV
jgi:hypothetical protein